MRKSGRRLAIFMLLSFPVHMSDSPLNQKKGFTARGLERLDVYAVALYGFTVSSSKEALFFLANIGHFTITTLDFICKIVNVPHCSLRSGRVCNWGVSTFTHIPCLRTVLCYICFDLNPFKMKKKTGIHTEKTWRLLPWRVLSILVTPPSSPPLMKIPLLK